MDDPKAPWLPEGWTRDTERNAARFKSEHRAIDVELTHEELCVGTQENYRGSYDNTSAFIPLPLLLEMLAAFEFHIVSEADRKVLEAMAVLPTAAVRTYEGTFSNERHRYEIDAQMYALWQAELARRSGT